MSKILGRASTMPRFVVSRGLRAGFCLGLLTGLLPAQVIINEIHYDPANRVSLEEFVELYNAGASAENLTGWFFSSGIRFHFPANTTLLPGAYLVVAQDPADFQARFGPGKPVLGPYAGRLSSQGDDVTLRDANGFLVDEVRYQSGFPWPTVGSAAGYSIELVGPDLDNDLGGSWRSSNPGLDTSSTLVPAGSIWRYLKGTAEASNPRGAWRDVGFPDNAWSSGPAAIGYGEAFIKTSLSDMQGAYSSVFLRKTFTVADASEVASLVLEVQFDDGFNAWINGVHVTGNNVPSDDPPFNATAGGALENLDFQSFPLPNPSQYLVSGTNVLAVQLLNASLGSSSDAFLDARLIVSSGAGVGPTPGAVNSVSAPNAAPQMRQLEHSPEQPLSGDPVRISVKATDPEGVASVSLEYQVVEPGAFIERSDAAYETSWTSAPMSDSGTGGDLVAGDSIWSALLPGSLQSHRRLIRYRITATDSLGLSIRAPYPDDPQPNFAYFVHDGVPGWSGAIEPGSGVPARSQIIDYPPEVFAGLPAYYLITKKTSTEDCTWLSKYGGDNYLWSGALVYDGKVYDHIQYRARGGVWRYSMGKNMWKFDFLKGHSFQARDDFGRKYDTTWDKLNFSAVIQQGDYLHRGEQGLFESVGFKLFNLAGVPASRTTFVTFHIVDEAAELGPSQFDGDFWGLYLVIEQLDGRFLDEHGFPDGNLYKMEGGTGELNNQGPTAVTDKSDLTSFLGTYQGTTPTDEWWRSSLDLERYYSYRSIVESIHHFDIGDGKNYFYYLNPDTAQWTVLAWDLDLTWADNMYGSGNEPFNSRVLPRPAFSLEYKSRMRELRDLLYNPDQTGQLIDEFAGMIDEPNGDISIVDADRSRWDYNPVMVNSSIVNLSKAGQGRYYQRAASKDFRGMAGILKSYVSSRGSYIDSNIAADPAIPGRPTISYVGPAGYPADQLTFRSSAFSDPQGAGTFGGMRWRVGEVAPSGAPDFDPATPRPYEVEAVWDSGELPVFGNELTLPGAALRAGARYRARVRMKDTTGRWSRWSLPHEFVAGVAAAPFSEQSSLRVTEVMFHPPQGNDFEFVEVKNVGPSAVDLTHVEFTEGIRFRFGQGAVASLEPGELLVVVENEDAFRTRYPDPSILVAGQFSGQLDNAGDHITLALTGGSPILDFTYDDAWYPPTDGGGYSLVIVDENGPTSAWSLKAGWTVGGFDGGSPGADEGSQPLGGLQLPGDSNQDGVVDLSDAVNLLFHLFLGAGKPLPCDGGTVAAGGNQPLHDVTGDGQVNLGDVLHVLQFLFRNGPPPALGTSCVRIVGCPNACF